VLESKLAHRRYLCGVEPTIADLCCYADIAFAEICDFDLTERPNIRRWAARVAGLPGFAAPFGLLSMEDAEVT
jgi:glutathione S-transferase